MSNAQEATAKHFPEHGPIDPKTGKEVLVSLKNVDEIRHTVFCSHQREMNS